MKNKELKNLAKKIAECELTIEYGSDPDAVQKAQDEIMQLCSSIESFEELDLIDEMVQNLLSKKISKN